MAAQAIRRSFLALFTKKALATYVQLQDGVIRRHLADWIRDHGGREFDIKHVIRLAAGPHPLPLPWIPADGGAGAAAPAALAVRCAFSR